MTEDQFYKLAEYYIALYNAPQRYPDRPHCVMLETLCVYWREVPVLSDLWAAESYNIWIDDNEDKMVVFHD